MIGVASNDVTTASRPYAGDAHHAPAPTQMHGNQAKARPRTGVNTTGRRSPRPPPKSESGSPRRPVISVCRGSRPRACDVGSCLKYAAPTGRLGVHDHPVRHRARARSRPETCHATWRYAGLSSPSMDTPPLNAPVSSTGQAGTGNLMIEHAERTDGARTRHRLIGAFGGGRLSRPLVASRPRHEHVAPSCVQARSRGGICAP